MTALNYHEASFLKSARVTEDMPPDQGQEIAFVGRSNAGKSSALNAITGIKGLARTSKTPGRTQLFNFFVLNEHTRLVDLPGYGYAKVPKAMRQAWGEHVHQYLETRESLRGVILVMDIRHPLKEQDSQFISWAAACELPLHILLTKADKLKRGAIASTLLQVQEAVSPYASLVTVQCFSALKNIGIEEIHERLNHWFSED